jgi:hypothetical protein
MRAAAYDFYDRRERQVYGEYLRRSAVFFREAALCYDDPFWTARASLGHQSRPGDGPSDFDLEHDQAVRLIFERLRDAPHLGVVPASGVRIDQTGVIEGREVVLRRGIVIPGVDAPVRFAAGVNLPELVELAPDCRDVAALVDAYQHRVAAVDPRDLLVGLSWLVTRGVLSAP